jgi:tetratricopeptide (TPR) repeat protein
MNAYAAALIEAALQEHKAGRFASAVALLKLILGASGRDGYVLYALGRFQYDLGLYTEAETALSLSVRIESDNAAAFNDLAATLFALRRDAEGLAYIHRALELRPDLAESQETDSLWLLRYGRFREGWRRYEARTRTGQSERFRRDFVQPRWSGGPVQGRTVLLYSEQGIGDTIQFMRYAPLVAARGARVVLEVHPGLGALTGALAGVETVIEGGTPLPPFDLQCPMLSLPLAFDTDLDSIPATIPYLSVPQERIWRWRTLLGPRQARRRIGIAWSGNPLHREDARRSIPLERFARLLTPHPDREFHVLQTDIRDRDRAVLARLGHVRDHSASLRDFTDTAALVSLMDLVISVDTSVAHLAGALGWPVWLLLASLADWRWLLERDDSPWYPTFWLFRQKAPGDWDTVLDAVMEQMEAMLG